MKIKVIANPQLVNGHHRYLRALVQQQFGHHVVGIEQTTCPQHATDIARRAASEHVDTVVAVGGDGTVNEVINGIVGSSTALGIISAGTANDLASLYRIPTDVGKACEVILERHVQEADVINVNGWYYVTVGGLGLPSEVASMANTIKKSGAVGKLLRKILGSHIYTLAMMGALLKTNTHHNPIKIQSSDTNMENVNASALLVANQPFLGKHFIVSPEAVNNDGRFNVCLIENTKRLSDILLILMKAYTGEHVHSPFVKTWACKELVINTDRPLTFFGDGEVCQEGVEFRISIFPRAIKIIVPKATQEYFDEGTQVGSSLYS